MLSLLDSLLLSLSAVLWEELLLVLSDLLLSEEDADVLPEEVEELPEFELEAGSGLTVMVAHCWPRRSRCTRPPHRSYSCRW